jgi:DNA-binding response OmpR family regulator
MRVCGRASGVGMNILLVEDDPGIARFVTRGLNRSGYSVEWRREGAGVAARLDEGRHDALLLDLGLPDMDGLEVAEAVKRRGMEIPIIMLTARGALQDRLDGFASGADDYLAKPFAFEELLARLAVALRRRDTGAPFLRYEMLTLDVRARTVRCGGRHISLAKREFDLLVMLARAGGAVVRREALIAGVWSDSPDVSDNALDVYIGYVRRRLAQLENAPKVETARGQGFRLAPAAPSES